MALNRSQRRLVEQVTLLQQHGARFRVADVACQEAAGDALDKGFADSLSVGLGDPDAGMRTAVVLGNNHVLGHIDQAPGQVTGICRAQRRVGQTLAGAVR